LNSDYITAPLLDSILRSIPEFSNNHSRSSEIYRLIAAVLEPEVDSLFGKNAAATVTISPFGDIKFPFTEMGAISSVELFGLDELLLFVYYWISRNKYANVADIGANIGLHSMLMSRCGYTVHSYEPDQEHVELLKRNINANGCESVTVYDRAVTTFEGEVEFTKVLGNTTSSHISGSKDAPYGDLEYFKVQTATMSSIMEWSDFMKIDVEGHEAEILCDTTPEQWANTEAVVEIGSDRNAEAVYNHFADTNVGIFAQNRNWQRIEDISQMPTSYKDGSVFISAKPAMDWSGRI
jgi:FkbM family methyltransferase